MCAPYSGTVGSSWGGSLEAPEARTFFPVLVQDEEYPGVPQQLRPHEAEKLMGMPAGVTEGPGISNLQRLTAVGNGWDINVMRLFFSEYRKQLLKKQQALTAAADEGRLGFVDKKRVQLMLAMREAAPDNAFFAARLADCSTVVREAVMQRLRAQRPASTTLAESLEQLVQLHAQMPRQEFAKKLAEQPRDTIRCFMRHMESAGGHRACLVALGGHHGRGDLRLRSVEGLTGSGG